MKIDNLRIKKPGLSYLLSTTLIAAVILFSLTACDKLNKSNAQYASSPTFTQYQGGVPVEKGTPLRFPDDHGAHPKQGIEWWYLTANLTSESGKTFGVQWTLFRAKLPNTSSDTSASTSTSDNGSSLKNPWWQDQFYFAHFALQSNTSHHAFERFGRTQQVDIQTFPFLARIDDWSLASVPLAANIAGADADADADADAAKPNLNYPETTSFLPLKLTAHTENNEGDFGINITLTDSPIITHGEAGYSQKTPQGSASYYYSLPFLNANGILTYAGETFQVTGKAWLDREWSGGLMGKEYTGWDWFSLQSGDEQSAIMAFCLRGPQHTYQYCDATYMEKNGNSHVIPHHDITLTVLQSQQLDNRAYPIKWSLSLGDESFIIEAINKDSRNKLTFPYWEGRVTFKSKTQPGQTNTKYIQGKGYAELTGY